jgi:hypothetical protein
VNRNILTLLAALPLLACTPAGDKADTGEAIAEGAGIGDGPTGRVGDPVARGADNGPIPANIDEGLEPAACPSSTLPTTSARSRRWRAVHRRRDHAPTPPSGTRSTSSRATRSAKAAELGFGAIYVSEESGGIGLGRLESALILEAMSYGCPSTSAFISIHNMAAWMIDRFGSDDGQGRSICRA